jgi:hypothetical protein
VVTLANKLLLGWSDRQERVLKQEAELKGLNITELLKRILDDYIDKKYGEDYGYDK